MNLQENTVAYGEEQPKTTVIMPVYNSPDLFTTLDSVRRQSYRPVQLIMIDDASASFKEDYIREFLSTAGDGFSFYIIKNPQNLGTVRSLNRGLAQADGKYLFNLAGDDVFADEHVLEDWVTAFEQTTYDALTARRADCDYELEKILSVSPPEKAVQAIRTLSSEALFEYIARDNPISGACTAWRLESLKKLGFYDERYRMIEDYPAYLKLLRQGGRIGFFDRVVIRYRDGGMSSEGSSYSENYIHDYNRIVREEILPYTRHPVAAKNRLRRWNHNVCFDRWYNREKTRCRRNASKFILDLMYYAFHPIRTLRKIKSVSRRK